ncbi:hypothetical protein [Bombiscardovia coagulans]|uniref:hypothetical protein n=1 Tax=Bombiscardovia coagulans TaxID=686666 RepID=UPI000B9A367C|nr:hypothetical protein [Bombiscardovia coagulans]
MTIFEYTHPSLHIEDATNCPCHNIVQECVNTIEQILASSTRTLDETEETLASASRIDWQGDAAQAYRENLQKTQLIIKQHRHNQVDCQRILAQAQL